MYVAHLIVEGEVGNVKLTASCHNTGCVPLDQTIVVNVDSVAGVEEFSRGHLALTG